MKYRTYFIVALFVCNINASNELSEDKKENPNPQTEIAENSQDINSELSQEPESYYDTETTRILEMSEHQLDNENRTPPLQEKYQTELIALKTIVNLLNTYVLDCINALLSSKCTDNIFDINNFRELKYSYFQNVSLSDFSKHILRATYMICDMLNEGYSLTFHYLKKEIHAEGKICFIRTKKSIDYSLKTLDQLRVTTKVLAAIKDKYHPNNDATPLVLFHNKEFIISLMKEENKRALQHLRTLIIAYAKASYNGEIMEVQESSSGELIPHYL